MFNKAVWHPPLVTSPRWQTRQLSLGFTVPDPCDYRRAVASVLCQYSLPPVFDVLIDSQILHYDTTGTNVRDADSGATTPVVLALALGTSQTAQLAINLGIPILLTAIHQADNQDVIKITFDIGFLSQSQASWLILHIEWALREAQSTLPAPLFTPRMAEELLFHNDELPPPRRYQRPDSSMFPPRGTLVHTCFYERVKAMPLAPAICLFHLQQDSTVMPVANVNYLELFLCAVKFIRRLETRGIHHGDSVVLGQLQPHLAAITTVALSMSGIASIPAEALADVNNPLASAIITEIHFPGIDLPVIDPPQYGSNNDTSTEEILWLRLPEIRGEEQFLFDTTSGTFASNADILAALLKDYKSISSGNMQVLYADQRVDSRMLGMIWQTLFVSVTEVHES